MRQKRFKQLQTACADMVADGLQKDLETLVRGEVGQRESGTWFRYEDDPRTDSPVLWFDYESALPATGGYIIPAVKLEFGSLTDRRADTPSCRCWPKLFRDWKMSGKKWWRWKWSGLSGKRRRFYTPSTIVQLMSQSEIDFPGTTPIWRQPAGAASLARLDLLKRVALFKSRFFGSPWASYDRAKPGSL
jgi:hypothetical protein